jgi:hypothetical protein
LTSRSVLRQERALLNHYQVRIACFLQFTKERPAMTDMSGLMQWGNQTVRFRFSIRTANGLSVDRLVIHGRDQADAERKLRQMYRRCEITECVALNGAPAVPGSAHVYRG